MSEFLSKVFIFSLIAISISIVSAWVNRGSGNRRMFYFGMIPVLISFAILGFDLVRKRYNANDYSTKQIVVKECRIDDENNGVIIASDDSIYAFDRSLLRIAGSESKLARMMCEQRNLNIWLNSENEVSGVVSEQFSIPLEIGIESDNSKHNFISLVFIFAPLGLFLTAIALWADRKKIDLRTGKMY